MNQLYRVCEVSLRDGAENQIGDWHKDKEHAVSLVNEFNKMAKVHEMPCQFILKVK